MRAWIVRFVSLYVFTAAVLLLIGWLMPSVRVGWSALWAGLLLTIATIWLKPLVTRLFQGMAAKSAERRTKLAEKVVQFGLVLLVEFLIWFAVVLFSGVDVRGFLWGWILPPFALLLAWIVYDAVDDRLEAHAGRLYDKASGKLGRSTSRSPGAASDSRADAAARSELQDGLTPEQRRMLDDLGKS